MRQTTLTQSRAPGVLPAGPIPHNSIHLLIITTNRFCRTLLILLDMSFSLSLYFLPVLSLQTSVCSTLKFYPVFSGVIMSIRSFFSISVRSWVISESN